uniref:ARAD1A03498p n=1 Tax=Blastobotrys adeninivorans TaxID=409370 RepID=A0A060SXG8_BLAAD
MSYGEVAPSWPKIVVPPCRVPQPGILSHWRHEARHEAQEVVPGLWLGPASVLEDKEFLTRNYIWACVSLVDPGTKVNCPISLQMYKFHPGNKINDSTCLVSAFGQINRLIDLLRRSGTPVILVCENGNDKSAAAAAAYMIHSDHSLDFVDAIQRVQTTRFCISLDDISKYNVRTFWDLSQAHRAQAHPHQGYQAQQVYRQPYQSHQSFESVQCASRKRQVEEDDDWGHFGQGMVKRAIMSQD